MPPVLVKCQNCHGTGTVFPFKTAKSKQCPVCKGKCKIPKEPK